MIIPFGDAPMLSSIKRFLVFAPFFLSACAPTVKSNLLGNPQEPYPPPHKPQLGDILHIPTGYYVSKEQMLRIAGHYRLVYVGETHDNPASHRLELTVVKAMVKRYPGRVAMGMEMFTPAQQGVLDEWVAGKLTERQFLKKSRWYETWRMDYDYYKPLLDFARENRIPVVGLNAEKRLVKEVGQKDLSDLPAKERDKLPKMNMDDPYERALVNSVFGVHAHGNGNLQSFLRVQTLWDETMAHNVAKFLSAPGKGDWHMVVLAGGNHIRYGFGIPRRVFRRLPVSYLSIGSREIVIPKKLQGRLMNITEPDYPMIPYDFVAFTKYETLPGEKVKLGVLLEEKDHKVTIGDVFPDSTAAAADLRKGDVLLKFDGHPVTELFDVIYEVKQKKPGDKSTLLIKRGDKEMSVEVTFKKMPAHPHDEKKK
jgi:uncharacterized iron-regulated protein